MQIRPCSGHQEFCPDITHPPRLRSLCSFSPEKTVLLVCGLCWLGPVHSHPQPHHRHGHTVPGLTPHKALFPYPGTTRPLPGLPNILGVWPSTAPNPVDRPLLRLLAPQQDQHVREDKAQVGSVLIPSYTNVCHKALGNISAKGERGGRQSAKSARFLSKALPLC